MQYFFHKKLGFIRLGFDFDDSVTMESAKGISKSSGIVLSSKEIATLEFSSKKKMVRNYKRKTEDRWTKEDLLVALNSIRDSKCKINDAARQSGISRATLYRQYQKFVQAGGKLEVNQFRTCGGNPILTKVEEDVLEKTILDLREQGFTVSSADIKRICYEYCDSNNIPNQFSNEKRMASDDWYYGFLKRHDSVRGPRTDGKPEVECEITPKKRRRSCTKPEKRRKVKKSQ